jgi:glucokinase
VVPQASPAGLPAAVTPAAVTPPPDRAAIGVDIGGTKVAAGLVDASGVVLARARRLTPSLDPLAVRSTVAEVVAELRDAGAALDAPPVAVGVGAAGFVDGYRARVVFAPHLAWRDEPLRDAVAADVGLPVVVENDANAAAWAEYRFGAGRGEPRLVCVTLGTGIGGGIVTGGRLERGRWGMAGEFGHMVVVPDGRRCECGNRGCLEQYASGNVLGREARAMAAAGSLAVAGMLERAKGDPDGLVGEVVTTAAHEGDRAAVELLEQVGHWLGVGLANLAAALDPGLFVIGGGVSAAGEQLLEPARHAFARHLTGRGFRPLAGIVAAALGPEAGLVGAADLARTSLAQEWIR